MNVQSPARRGGTTAPGGAAPPGDASPRNVSTPTVAGAAEATATTTTTTTGMDMGTDTDTVMTRVPATAIGAARRILRPLATGPFRLVWAGQAAALVADQAFLVALTWLVLEVAGPGGALGTVLAVAAVPGVVLLPVGGWLSDRFGPARMMTRAGVGRAALLAAMAALVLLDAVTLWRVALLGGALSALDALHYPAALSIVPLLVVDEDLAPANALVEGAEQLSGLVGPALAAAALATVGMGATLGGAALAFAATAAAFGAVVRAAARAARQPGAPPGEPSPAERGSLLVGFVHAWRDPLIRPLVIVLAAVSLAGSGPMLVGGAALAETRFGGAGAFGWLLSSFGGGSLLGVVGAGVRSPSPRRGTAVVAAVVAGLGVGMAAVAVVPSLWPAAAIAGGMGIGSGFLGVVLTSWLQERVAPAVRGRVMGVVVFATVALDPVSYALTGWLVAVDLRALFFGSGALLGVVAAAAAAAGAASGAGRGPA